MLLPVWVVRRGAALACVYLYVCMEVTVCLCRCFVLMAAVLRQVTVVGGVSHVELQTVNCEAQGDCLYTGAISITSTSGDVSLNIQEWDRSTDAGFTVSCAA